MDLPINLKLNYHSSQTNYLSKWKLCVRACCMIMRECVYASKQIDAAQKSLNKGPEDIIEHKLRPHSVVALSAQYPMLQL